LIQVSGQELVRFEMRRVNDGDLGENGEAEEER
jgi:hypothetical protein